MRKHGKHVRPKKRLRWKPNGPKTSRREKQHDQAEKELRKRQRKEPDAECTEST